MKHKIFFLFITVFLSQLTFSESNDKIDLTRTKYDIKISILNNIIEIANSSFEINDPIEEYLNDSPFKITKDYIPSNTIYGIDNFSISFWVDSTLDKLMFYRIDSSEAINSISFNKLEFTSYEDIESVKEKLDQENIIYIIKKKRKHIMIEFKDIKKLSLVFDSEDDSLIYIGVTHNTTEELDQYIIDNYNYKITEDKIANTLDESFYKCESKDDFYNKLDRINLLYTEWINENMKVYKTWNSKKESFKTKEEKYILKSVSTTLFYNTDIIGAYLQNEGNKLLNLNPQYKILNFTQKNSLNSYEVSNVILKSIAWDIGVPTYCVLEIHFKVLDDYDKRMKISLFNSTDGLLKSSTQNIHSFERKNNGDYTKEFAGSLTGIDILKKMDYIEF